MRTARFLTILIAAACLTRPVFLGAAAIVTPPAVSASTTSAPDAGGLDFFEKRIRPVLSQQCYKCHANSSEKVKGSLLLDSRQGAIQGGDTGPAVVPGHPEKSLLIEAIQYTNDDLKMPPKTKLAASVVSDLTKWVQMGAPWPEEKNAVIPRPAGTTSPTANYDRLRKEHWAWQPLHDAPTPAVRDGAWCKTESDRFVLAQLEAKGLTPVADADKLTLIRRVTFDLVGLPPTPAEVAAFVSDTSPDAYAKVVDRLLASPSFGERWGRHWLDIARFGESTGSSRNIPYNYAWRYRDYVIDSFNKDKPYDRFICEQIAGDLLPYSTAQEHHEQLIATGFLAIGVKDLNERDHEKFVMDNVDEQIDVTTRSIMALTVACARCHDHKFDPIPTADYYSMAGIFRSTDILSGVKPRGKGAGKKDYSAPDSLLHLDNVPATASTVTQGHAQLLSANDSAPRITRLQAKLDKLRTAFENANRGPARKAIREEIATVKAELESLQGGAPATSTASMSTAGPSAMGVRDSAGPSDTSIRLHGEPHDLGPVAPRGFATVVPVHSISQIDPAHSGRLQLAQWLTSSENPLTPRVMTNRIWSHLFGEGIVRTVDNFGSTGEAPSNPDLLDHLATQFIKQGWSVKKLVREMVLSHAYQLSSVTNSADFAIDPNDRLNWRMLSRRLDAEEIRDAMLAISGRLDLSVPQGSLAAGLDVAELRGNRLGTQISAGNHRSTYLPILRDLVPPVLDLFDFAEPTMVIGTRDTTTVATQALFMMNDAFVVQQAHDMASRIQTATGLDDAGRVDLAYRLALSRPATSAEKTRATKYVSEFQRDAMHGTKDSVKNARSDGWASFCQALLASAEFRYLN